MVRNRKIKKKYYGEPAKKQKFDSFGQLFLLAYADRYVMCRRPGAMPFVMPVGDWDALSDVPIQA